METKIGKNVAKINTRLRKLFDNPNVENSYFSCIDKRLVRISPIITKYHRINKKQLSEGISFLIRKLRDLK